MPTNLYGINDNFHPTNSHVIPALIQRFHKAKINNEPKSSMGSGNVSREFLYVDDMADASLFILGLNKKIYMDNTKPMLSHINIGSGKDHTIKKVACIIKEVVGFKGEIVFDESKPDGPKRKLTDVSKIEMLGWKSTTSLSEGLDKTYKWYSKSNF